MAGLTAVLPTTPAQALFNDFGNAAKWQTSFTDNFSTGTVPDPNNWTRRLGNDKNGGDGDWNIGTQERQFYTGTKPSNNPDITLAYTGADSDNTQIINDAGANDGKALEIATKRNTDNRFQCAYTPGHDEPVAGTCAFTSAFIRTKKVDYAPFGRLETRVKLPAGAGLLPSFWAQGKGPWPDSQEIDVFESEDAPGSTCTTVCSSLHGPNRQHKDSTGVGDWSSALDSNNQNAYPTFGANPQFNDINSISTLSSGYHKIAADWYPDRMEFSVDDRVYNIIRKSEMAEGSWVFDQPFYAQLNIAVKKYGGEIPPLAPGPWKMNVDYVKIFTPVSANPHQQLAQVGYLQSPGVAGGPAKCTDAVWGASDPGTKLQLLSCKGAFGDQNLGLKSTNSPAQYWSVQPDGTIRSNMNLDVCVANPTGTEVSLQACNGSASQKWTPDQQGRLGATSGNCLSTQGKSRNDNTLLVTDTCDGSNAEKWSLPMQPAAEWPLHNYAGTAVFDSTGGQKNAACTSTWIKEWDQRGWSAKFNGAGQACTAPASVLDSSKSFTVSAWARLPQTVAGGNYGVLSQDGTQASAFYLGYDGAIKRWYFKMPNTDSASPSAFPSAKSTADGVNGAWAHLVGVYSAETGSISLYLNGQLQQTTPVTPPWKATGSLAIGRAKWAGTAGDFFPDLISDVRVWSSALAAPSVKGLYDLDVFKVNIPLPEHKIQQ
ncbi:MAG: LamG-like jellyroll fold domain-containing protein [Streptosporangiaceae bacterium]